MENVHVALKIKNLEDFMQSRKLTDIKLAAETTISLSQIIKVKKGTSGIGSEFIAKMINTYPDQGFDYFFEVLSKKKRLAV
ncbi:hypothetical protein [Desulforamulus ruminis]|uniref:HTH cro/C1-type domain-containing protein n=1 Tax=Desulforamulus ruminis (strain ATCC 23193 / DSM 2154 / NCIMB 8452 / DL) TaxID=696281 RepID=F6DQ55_DESRL|nr:hypothetical protein [Desulforamulus ruminis]AEG61999.1 hypothetical protein Desru_3799 [Desulforamulus ruminis DSM 2154]